MMNSAQGCEARYIVRALQGKMRIGLDEPSVLVAIGHAFALSPPPAVAARAEAVPRNADERKEFLNSMAAIVKACMRHRPDWNAAVPWVCIRACGRERSKTVLRGVDHAGRGRKARRAG